MLKPLSSSVMPCGVRRELLHIKPAKYSEAFRKLTATFSCYDRRCSSSVCRKTTFEALTHHEVVQSFYSNAETPVA